MKAFADAARKQFKTMSVGEDDEGGYTVPQDIQTRINQYRDATFNLRQLVRVETVTAPTGIRIFQVKGSQAAWTSIGEGTAIGVKNTPTFERATYSIKKYGGIFPVTNELLKDSDANITRVLTEWIGDGSRVTGNSLILTAIATKSQTNLADLEGIKKALIKTLGQAYMPTSSIVTNDDGLLYLSTLQDGNGRDLLSQDPFRPMELWLSVAPSGFHQGHSQRRLATSTTRFRSSSVTSKKASGSSTTTRPPSLPATPPLWVPARTRSTPSNRTHAVPRPGARGRRRSRRKCLRERHITVSARRQQCM